MPVGSSPHDATRPRPASGAPRSPGRLFDRRGASAVRLRSTQTGKSSSLRTNIFASALAFAFAVASASTSASSFASRETFFPPGALFSFSVAFESPDDDDTGEPAADADGGGGGFEA